MSSISIKSAQGLYGGSTELETARNMARSGGYWRIYKYANDYGDQITHTDYKQISGPSAEPEFLNSSRVHNVVLVYDRDRHG